MFPRGRRLEVRTNGEILALKYRLADALCDKARRATKAKNRRKWKRHAAQLRGCPTGR